MKTHDIQIFKINSFSLFLLFKKVIILINKSLDKKKIKNYFYIYIS
jgi:hypothetical protein